MKNFFLLLIAVNTLFACTKSVDLDPVTERKLVIEGNIFADSLAWVKLAKSIAATEEDIFPSVTEAVVQIQDTEGNLFVLAEISPGYYESVDLIGKKGEPYVLSIESDGQMFSSTCQIPASEVVLDSLSFQEITNDTSISDQFKNINVHFKKNTTDSIYCIFKLSVNGVPRLVSSFFKSEVPVLQIFDFRVDVLIPAVSATTYHLEMQLVEKWHFEYLQGVEEKANQQTIGGLLIGPPDNVIGNIKGDALGYFGGISIEEIELVIP